MGKKASLLLMALISCSPGWVSAQNLTSRSSKLNISYTYGACADSNSGVIPKEDFSLVNASSISQPLSGATSGICPNQIAYTATVRQSAFHGYEVTGPLNNFSRIRGWGSNSAYTSATGLGTAQLLCSAPGNQLILTFTVSSVQNYNISGQTTYNDVGCLVALQFFDGFTWQAAPFYSLFLPTGQGRFNQSGTLNPGTYRVLAEAATNAFGNEFSGAGYIFDLFLGAAPTILQGTVTLEDYQPDENGEEVTVELYQNSNLVHTTTAVLGVNGSYSVASPVAGVAQVRIKGRTWLAERSGNLTLTANAVTPLNMTLINGDCDGDNAVTIFDYIEISNAFDSGPLDANWNPNADLDGDQLVSIFDYIILSDNFDRQGD